MTGRSGTTRISWTRHCGLRLVYLCHLFTFPGVGCRTVETNPGTALGDLSTDH